MTAATVLKRALFDHLLHRCYVKLAPSRIAGVGVRAVRDIPPDVDPFVSPNAHLHPPEPPCIAVCEDEITVFPAEVRSQLLSFFAVSVPATSHPPTLRTGLSSRASATGLTARHLSAQALDDPRDPTGTTRLRHPTGGLVYGVNATGLERLDASWFVNHGEDPNVRYCEATEEGVFNRYVTTRTVRAGGVIPPPRPLSIS